MFFSPAVDELSLQLSGEVTAACDTFLAVEKKLKIQTLVTFNGSHRPAPEQIRTFDSILVNKLIQ